MLGFIETSSPDYSQVAITPSNVDRNDPLAVAVAQQQMPALLRSQQIAGRLVPGIDNSTLLLAGLAILALVLIAQGRRR